MTIPPQIKWLVTPIMNELCALTQTSILPPEFKDSSGFIYKFRGDSVVFYQFDKSIKEPSPDRLYPMIRFKYDPKESVWTLWHRSGSRNIWWENTDLGPAKKIKDLVDFCTDPDNDFIWI